MNELSFDCGAGEAFEFDFDKFYLGFHNFPLKVGSSLQTAIEIEKLMKNNEKSLAYYNVVKGFSLSNGRQSLLSIEPETYTLSF